MKIEVGKKYRWKDIIVNSGDIEEDRESGFESTSYCAIDDGREVFFISGISGYRCIVVDYWDGGKDDPNPELLVVSKWRREE